MKQTVRFIFVALIVLALGATGCKEKQVQTSGPKERAVMVYEVQKTTDIMKKVYPATSKSSRTVDLAFRVGGPVTELNVKVGDFVKEGDVLAKIDPRDFLIAIDQVECSIKQVQASLEIALQGAREEDIKVLEAQLESAKAGLEKARQDYERVSGMYTDNIATKADFDAISATYKVAQASVKVIEQQIVKAKAGARKEEIDALKSQIDQLKVQLQSAENALADTILRAPFAGFIASKTIEKFQYVAKNATVVVLQDRGIIDVVISIPELEFSNLGELNDKMFSVRFQAKPEDKFKPVIKEISYVAQSYTSSFDVTLSVEVGNQSGIFPGMTAEVETAIQNGKHGTALRVPIASVVRSSMGSDFVWIMKIDSNKPEKREVSIGEIVGDMIEVTSNLSVGELVISNGAEYVSSDMQLRIVE